MRRYEKAVEAGRRAYAQELRPRWKNPYWIAIAIILLGFVAVTALVISAVVGGGIGARTDSVHRGELGDELAGPYLALTLSGPEQAGPEGYTCFQLEARNTTDRIWFLPFEGTLRAGTTEVGAWNRTGPGTFVADVLVPDGTAAGTICFDGGPLTAGAYEVELDAAQSFQWEFSVP
ncbi:MAG TPA: hypothetical protein GX743_03820 [Actinomycetales bacterium]|nr:hypothetical protein [Actinomycetales bacterium]